jgi:Ca2+-binding EF-hand superfamily protein
MKKRTYVIAGLTALSLAAGSGVALAKSKMGDMHGMRGGPMIDFKAADADGDGKLTEAEMAAHAKARFDAADTDGNGKLSADEIKAQAEARMEEARKMRVERMATRMIERMDADDDGEISFDEMPGQQTRAGMMFDRLDEDGDGAISAEEFAAARDMREGMRGKHRGEHAGEHGGKHRGYGMGDDDDDGMRRKGDCRRD